MGGFAKIVGAALMALGIGAVAGSAPPAPKLIIAISIDQFSADLFQQYRAGYSGGLRRLARGIAFTGYQSHAATETCPGHSTILTGRHPAATGIVANSWYDRTSGKSVYCVAVPGADGEARGPQNMRVDTFGDWLKQAKAGSRVFAISGKDRAAITMGGHHADAVYWWQDGKGFTTSPYAGPAGAAVTGPAQDFNRALFARWRASPPALWPAEVPAACVALEQPQTFGGITLSGKIPPDQARVDTADYMGNRAFQGQLRASTLFDPQVLDFAGEVIDRERLGHGPAIDLLALSFSSNDYVGHRYGAGGPEMCVQQAAIDRVIGALLAKLDGLGVPYMVVLTADHGGSDAPERAAANGVDARRLDPAGFVKELNAALRAQLGLAADPIEGEDPQQLAIRREVDPAMRAQVRAAAVAWLRARPEVVQVFTAEQVAAAKPPRGKSVAKLSLAERFHESYDPQRSGDIQVAFRTRTTLYMPGRTGEAVAGHGSPWDYDRRVPILFWWPGVKPAARAEPAETVDIAPTLAAIAGIRAPAVDGKCLAVVAGKCR